ncbi:MAG: DNA repair protein RecO [Magnetococcales bacterium]|nr:DNA repair protein RecO [Magnetococcales bacterium]
MKCSDQALVLRRIPFQETSLVIHYFSRERGTQSVLARGIRSRKGSERAALAGFHTINILGHFHPAHALGTLLQTDIVRGRHSLREIPLAMASAQVIQEMIYRFLPPGDPHPELFDLTETVLDQLDAKQSPLALLAFIQGVTLRTIGYGWRTDSCAGCGHTEPLTFFSVRRAQTVCQTCGLPYTRHIFSISPAEHHAMATLDWPNGFAPLSPEEHINLFRISSAGLTRFGGRLLDAERHFRHLIGLEPLPDTSS